MKIKFRRGLFSYKGNTLLKLIMRSFIFLFCSIAFAVGTKKGAAQNAKIVVNENKTLTVKQVFRLINKQTDYKFIYRHDLIKSALDVALKKGTIKAGDLLDKCLLPINFTYEFKDGDTIVVKEKVTDTVSSKETLSLKVIQQFTVTGTVTDNQGVPLPGANIVEKGTTNGVTADFDGNFSLDVDNENITLVVSYIGFSTKEAKIVGQATLTIVLEESASGLDEVVVVGYGSQRKSDVTGSVVRVHTEKTENLPNANVLQSLQGLVPGLNISTGGNSVGSNPDILIRGNNSLTASNNPLVVVDNVIYNGNISDFNSNDIESIDVLKDASAAAVYGARAANGVLLITTKKGKTGKPKFNFSTYTGFQKADYLIPVMNGPRYEQKIQDYNEILLANNPNASPIALTDVEEDNKAMGRNIDWVGKSLQTAPISNYHIDISGASDKTNYYISGTYFDQEGIVVNDKNERLTVNLNVTNQLTDWLSLSARTSFSASDLSGVPANLDQASRQSPYGDFYDENGPGGYAVFPIEDALGIHPLIPTLIIDENKRTSLRGVFSSIVDFPFIPGLKWTLNYGANLRNGYQNKFTNNELTTASQNQNGIATKYSDRNFDWTLDNILNYRKLFGSKHSLDLTFLFSRESRSWDNTNSTANDFVSQELGFNSLELGSIHQNSSNRTAQSSLSQMGRINYAYDGRYSLTYTLRRDGFSAFSENNKYATFQAVAFAWTLSNEDFLKDSDWLNHLKLRLSYGENGNQAINAYSSLSRIAVDQYLYGNGGTSYSTFGISSLANNRLTWETTTSKNIGLDFQILDNRISGAFDAYISNTNDLLQSRRVPAITGFESALGNIGEVQNKGFEFTLNSDNIINEDFGWQTGVVFSLNRNKIISLGGVDADNDGIEDDDISNGWFIGQPIDAIFGYKTEGIYQLNDQIPDGFRPGDFRLQDVNGDGEIGPDDRQILGTESPNYVISLSNTFRYKGFSLYVMLSSIQGGGRDNYYLGDNFETRSVNRRGFTTFTERFNLQDVPYWTDSNSTDLYPRLDYIPPYDHPILEDRSFIRIQDVSLAYSFEQKVLEKFGFANLRIYTSLKNLHTFTDWSGYNPETSSTVQDLPFFGSYTFGIDLSF